MTITTPLIAPPWWLETERLMSAADPSFSHRPQQAAAADILDRAIRTRAHAALDLPTGSGKSLLALAAAEQAHGRTVISTATKALQTQMRDKDVPALQAAGVLTREVVILDGRNNWACLARAVHEKPKANPASKKTIGAVIRHLKANPDQARRDTIPVAIPDWVWVRIASDSDACEALKCRGSKTPCAYTRLRERSRTADIVIVNHSLLLADATIKSGPVDWGLQPPSIEKKLGPSVFGPYQHLIVDEAHALENACESFGEQRVTIRGIQSLMARVSKHEGSGTAVKHLAVCLDELHSSMLGLPTGALLAPTGKEDTIFGLSVDAAKDAGRALRDGHTTFEGNVAAEILVSACYSLSRKLASIDLALRTGSDEFGPRACSADETGIKSQLVDAGPWLVKNLFGMVPTVAMSGTLAVPGNKDWVATRIGLPAKVEMLPTSFNLRTQRLVYVTPRVEDPRAMSARSTDADVRELEQLIDASSGRALVLFPANADLRFVNDRLKTTHLLLAQGVTLDGKSAKGEPIPMSNAALAQQFADDTHSVLLATKSFMEGVDFPGETASLVVIMRFPNLRPDDPLVLARRRLIEGRGGNPWTEYQEPAMQLIFRQAAGRAIRRVDDRGVVAVLDPRCRSKGYAKTALRSLAPSDYTDKVARVREFLG